MAFRQPTYAPIHLATARRPKPECREAVIRPWSEPGYPDGRGIVVRRVARAVRAAQDPRLGDLVLDLGAGRIWS